MDPASDRAPNAVHVYQVGEVGDQVFIAMEFVNGTTLSKWQAEPSRSWQKILRTYVAAGQGLLAAHDAGLIQRVSEYPRKTSRKRDLRWA